MLIIAFPIVTSYLRPSRFRLRDTARNIGPESLKTNSKYGTGTGCRDCRHRHAAVAFPVQHSGAEPNYGDSK